MLLLLSDENFNGEIVRGVWRRNRDIDLVRVQDVGLRGIDDPSLLAWAADNQRVLLTHDRATMVAFASDRIANGLKMAGLFVFDDRVVIGQAIQDVLLFAELADPDEMANRVLFF